EIGHYLGLRHIWGTDTSPMLDSECQNDDGIADTPLQHLPSGFCPTSAADRPHTCGSPDMFVNYMDYTEDACLNMFTKQQVTVMHTVLQEFRPRLIEGKIKYHPVPPQRDFTPFFVYPNPTTDRFFVDFDAYGDERSRITIELYNINGRLILSKKVNKEVRVEVLVTNLPKGIYLVKVGDTVKKLFRS
ncbi:MAG: zinc-dependent metalloprotease, partial [Bacteroidota bacterium]